MGVRRREAQGTPGLLSEDISAPASAREISGIDDGHAREMVRGGGDLAWDALHEDVVGPARGSVEELDHIYLPVQLPVLRIILSTRPFSYQCHAAPTAKKQTPSAPSSAARDSGSTVETDNWQLANVTRTTQR